MFHRTAVATLCLLALIAAPALHADETCPRFIGRWGGPSHTRAVAVSGDHAFFGSCGKLVAADISNPSAPLAVGELALPGDATDLETTPTQLFAVVMARIHAIDITNPQALAEIGSYSGRRVVDAAVAGDLLYLATGSGLSIVDASDAAAMQEIATVAVDGSPVAVAVADGSAYIAYNDSDQHGAIQIVDVTDAHDPQTGDTVHLSGFPDPYVRIEGVAASGQYLYATSTSWEYEPEVQIFALADAQPPAYVRSLSTASPYSIRSSADGAVYLADGTGIIQLAGGRATWQLDTPGSARAVAVTADVAVIADETDLQLATISSPIGLVGSWRSAELSRLTGMAIAGDDLVVVADADRGARFLDISTPAATTEIATVERDAAISAITAGGHHVYIADQLDRLAVIDISSSRSPSVVGLVELEQVTDITANSSHVYAAAGDEIVVVDAGNPAAPALVGRLPADSPVIDLEVHGGLLLVSHDSGLRILDLAEPAFPRQIGELPLGLPGKLAASAGQIYVGTATERSSGMSGRLATVDITDPSRPTLGEEVGTADMHRSLAAAGTILAVNGVSYYGLSAGLEDWKLWIIDARDAGSPTDVGSYSGMTLATMAIAGTRLLCRDNGLMIFDLSCCDGTDLEPYFSWWPSQPVAGEPVWFYDTSTGLPTEWRWDFGDGVTSSEQNPSHIFSGLPVRVTLEVGNGSETRQISKGVPAAFPVRRGTRRHH
jgi:hypothetical protein